jgi:hypothetical protein
MYGASTFGGGSTEASQTVMTVHHSLSIDACMTPHADTTPALLYLERSCPLRLRGPAEVQQLLGWLKEGGQGGIGQGEHPAGHLHRQ